MVVAPRDQFDRIPFIEPPTAEQLRTIKAFLQEDDARLENNVRLLREWMACQSYLPKDYLPSMLPVVLRSCRHDLAKSKRKIVRFFATRRAVPEMMLYRDITKPDVREILENAQSITLPKLSPEGFRLTINRLYEQRPNVRLDVGVALGTLSADLRAYLDYPCAGDVLIFDASNCSPQLLTSAMTPAFKKMVTAAPESMPFRIERMHVINCSPLLERVVNIVKRLFKEKIANRMHVHSDASYLCEHYPRAILPREYGGELPSVDELYRGQVAFYDAHVDWFEWMAEQKCVGDLPTEYRDVLGRDLADGTGGSVEGAFRKLDID